MGDRCIAEPDVIPIGACVMSATLNAFLKELEPSLAIEMFETLEDAGQEISEAWNNAGTGDAANAAPPAAAEARLTRAHVRRPHTAGEDDD